MNDRILKIIRYAQSFSPNEAAKKFGISRGRVYQIVNNNKKKLADAVRDIEYEVMQELTQDGWIVLRNGYPDLFCYHPEKKSLNL